MTERCCFSVASSCADKRPIPDYDGIRIRERGSASELEEIVKSLLGAARLLRIIRLAAHGRGGFTLPCRATGKVRAVVGHILRRHARADPDRAFEARARIEVHALNAR